MLTKIECGGLEFQLGYFTELNCKVMGRTKSSVQVVMIYTWEDGIKSSIEYVLDLFVDDNKTVTLLHIMEVSGHITTNTMKMIDRALETFNALNER